MDTLLVELVALVGLTAGDFGLGLRLNEAQNVLRGLDSAPVKPRATAGALPMVLGTLNPCWHGGTKVLLAPNFTLSAARHA